MEKKSIVVLGSGLVGGPMALDLAAEARFAVTVADINKEALEQLRSRDQRIETVVADLADTARVTELVSGFDLVLSAVPGFMGYATLEAVIEAGRNVVDIAFFAEDPFALNDKAKQAGVTAVVDCGVAPGLSNLLIGRVAEELDSLENALIYVGGLPEVRQWPYEYKAGFSPIDVIAEYTRPARYVENGQMVTRPALSDPELVDFPGIGTLEAFNTDGLRSLAVTIECPEMKEKTLRYPGHIEKMALLRETGFFSEDEIMVRGAAIRPIDLTAALLFPKWKLEEGEVDITVMRVAVRGRKEGREVSHTFDLLDRYDPGSGIHSMARTTGYTATAAVRMLAEGHYTEPGVSPPELIGRFREPTDFIVRCLAERGVVCGETVAGGTPILG